jgi:Ser/Thr protein kinase RdoA (MazF antagonist)
MLLEERVGQAITEAQAVEFARELYGLEVTAKSVPGEYDDNFHLTTTENATAVRPETYPGQAVTPGSSDFVLKVMHPARERALIDLQCRALQHLAQRAPQLSLPRVYPTRSGEMFADGTAADGSQRLVWLLSYVPGRVLAEVRPHSEDLLTSLGKLLGEMDVALADFSHSAAQRELKWDFARAGWIREYLHLIAEGSRRALVEKFLALYDAQVAPAMPWLRRSVVYGDANDHNVLVSEPWPAPRKATSVIDFGDMHQTFTVSEVAIAAAYAILGEKDPLRAAAAVVAGYHGAFPLTEAEIAVLYALIGTRLAVSVVNSARRSTVKPDDSYVTISEAPAWQGLQQLADVHPRLAHYTFRHACGLPPVPQSAAVRRWLRTHGGSVASLLDVNLRTAGSLVFDLSVGSTFLGADPDAAEMGRLSGRIFGELNKARVCAGVGRYDEARVFYTSTLFGASSNPTDERRTVHLGIDLFVAPGTEQHHGARLRPGGHPPPRDQRWAGVLYVVRSPDSGNVETA